MTSQQRSRAAASNAFTAEIGLLCSLAVPRVSARQEAAAGMLPPKPIKKGTCRSVPPLNERQLVTGEVQSLPNYGKLTLPASSTGHASIKEMQISRKSRHESEIEAYNLRRTGLEVDLEARTGRAGRDFRKLLALNDDELDAVFDELADDFLLDMEVHEVDDAWERIREEGVRRDEWTSRFEADLEAIEQERRGLADAEMSKLTDALLGIAHMLPSDVELLLEGMAHEINLIILANREVHARLCAKLRLREVERKTEHRARWESRLLSWRQLRHAHALGCFKLQLHQPHTVSPPERAAALAVLSRQQADFQARREEIMRSLAAIEPPDLTAFVAAAVSAQLDALAEEEADAEASRLAELRAVEDAMEETQREAVEFLRGRLLHFGAVEPSTVDAILSAEVEPLLVRRRREALHVIICAAASLRRQRRRLHEHALGLARDFVRAGQVFDVHTAETALVYEAFRDDVAAVRARSELEDHQMEAELDACLMRMRRAADKAELQRETQAAMGLLDDIQHGYRSMQSEAVDIVRQHPANVDGVLTGLHARICSSLDLRPRAEYAATAGAAAAGAASGIAEAAGAAGEAGAENSEGGDGEDGEIDEDGGGRLGGGTKRLDGEEEDLEATFGFVFPEKMRAEELLEDELAGLEPREETAGEEPNRMLVTTAGGAEWQMLTREEREAASMAGNETCIGDVPPPETNLQPVSEAARAERTSLALEGGRVGLTVLLVPSELSLRLRLGLAERCLSYHEAHAEAMRTRAADEADEVTAQLTLELDERLMAHQPRPGRVSTKILAERDEELLAHRERFMRHVKALRARRAQAGRAGDAAQATWRAAEAEHLAAIDKLSAALRLEKNVHAPTLLRLQREADAVHATYKAALEGRRGALVGSADGTLLALREFNAGFAATWHDFGVGGNFHAVERERFLERLDEQAAEAEAEAAAAREKAAALYEAQLTRADEAMDAFRAVLELNMEDVKMLEGLRLRQGQASADMRLVSTASAAQQVAIDQAIARAESLLGGLAGRANPAVEAGTASGSGCALLSAEAEAAAAGECGGGAALDAMWSLDALRVMVMQRARLLEVLGSTAVPESPPSISLEPPREGEAAPAPPAAPPAIPGSDVLAHGTLRAAIDAVRTRHEAGLVAYVEGYYTAKGEREISRPSFIPASMDEFRAKVGAMLAEMVEKAQADRVDATIVFREQLVYLKKTLAHFGPAVFETVAAGCRAAAAHAAASIKASHAPLTADLLRKRESHRLALKPALRNPANTAQRLALEQAEAERHKAAIAAVAELRAALRLSEQRHADTLLRRLPHTAAVVLGLLDGTLQPEDISEAEAPPPPDRHYGIFKQMRIQARQEAAAASEDPPMTGRPFKAHTWAGTPLRELLAPAEEARASATEGQEPGVAPPVHGAEASKAATEEASPPLTGCLARPQRLAMAARDRVYTSYRMHFEEQLQAIAKAADEMLRAERMWAANFTKQMVMLRNEA